MSINRAARRASASGISNRLPEVFTASVDSQLVADAALDAVSDELRAHVRTFAVDMAKRVVSSAEFAGTLRAAIVDVAMSIAKDELAERMPELRHHVERVVRDRWEASVDDAARAILSEALVEVRKRVAP